MDDIGYSVFRVAASGYQWQTDIEGRQVLVEKEMMLTARRTPYQPREITGLWRNFTQVRPTKTGFLRFVEKYGPLEGQTFNCSGELRIGDTLETLKRARRIVRHIADLRDELDSPAVPSAFIKHGSRGYLYEFDGVLQWFDAPDRITAGWDALQWTLNNTLTSCRIQRRLLWDSKHQKLTLHDVPETLFAFLVYQSARAVEGNRHYRQCARPECSGWFEISSPEGGRRDKLYCSDNCRQRDFQRKRREGLTNV